MVKRQPRSDTLRYKPAAYFRESALSTVFSFLEGFLSTLMARHARCFDLRHSVTNVELDAATLTDGFDARRTTFANSCAACACACGCAVVSHASRLHQRVRPYAHHQTQPPACHQMHSPERPRIPAQPPASAASHKVAQVERNVCRRTYPRHHLNRPSAVGNAEDHR